MLLMPMVFVFFIISFPAGLILYWITTNTWTIGQQAVVKRLSGGVKPADGSSDSGVSEGDRPVKEKAAKPAKGDNDASGDAKPKSKGGPPPQKSTKKRTGRRK